MNQDEHENCQFKIWLISLLTCYDGTLYRAVCNNACNALGHPIRKRENLCYCELDKKQVANQYSKEDLEKFEKGYKKSYKEI